MRIRARHIALVLLIALTSLVFYLTSRMHRDVEPKAFTEGLMPPMQESMENAPAIELETLALNVGVIPHDQETHATVRVYNRGKRTLEIRDIMSSCSLCTVGYFNAGDRTIAPGQSVEMQVIVKPSGIPGFHTVKTLSLITNDPRHSRLPLTVEAAIDPEFVLEPEQFDFGEVSKGDAAEAVIHFQTRIETPIRVLDVTLEANPQHKAVNPDIHFGVEPVEEPNWKEPGKAEYLIRATMSPEMRAGAFSTPVFIHTDLKRFSMYMTNATGIVQAPYTLHLDQSGPKLILRPQTPKTVITLDTVEDMDVTAVSSMPGIVMVQSEQIRPDQWLVTCSLSPDVGRGIREETVTLQITHGDRLYTERLPIQAYFVGN